MECKCMEKAIECIKTIKLDWSGIIGDIVSGTATAFICALAAWLIYKFGFKGKEDSQTASERKNEIYIPLRDELKAIYGKPENIWDRINVGFARKAVEDNAVFLLDETIARSLRQLFMLVDEYNGINLNTVAGNILCRRFREKYSELFGSATHLRTRYDEATNEEHEIEEDDFEVETFQHSIAYRNDDIRKIFLNREHDDFQIAIGKESPVSAYIARMFAMAFHGPETKYINSICDERIKAAIASRHITISEYMTDGFCFFDMFDNSPEAERKDYLLGEIRALAVQIAEDLDVIIRKIGKKYEKE